MTYKPRFEKKFRELVDIFVSQTGADASIAAQYLISEEGLIDEAIRSYKADNLCKDTLKTAIEHLQSVLNNNKSYQDQQNADTAARDFLNNTNITIFIEP